MKVVSREPKKHRTTLIIGLVRGIVQNDHLVLLLYSSIKPNLVQKKVSGGQTVYYKLYSSFLMKFYCISRHVTDYMKAVGGIYLFIMLQMTVYHS